MSLPKTLFLFFFTLLLWVISKNKWPVHKQVFWCGILWAVAAFCRPICLYFPPFIILYFLFFKKDIGWRPLLYFLPGLLLTSTWTYRNYKISGVATFATVKQFNIYAHNASQVVAYKTGEAEHLVRERMRKEIDAKIGDDPMDCSTHYHGIKMYEQAGFKIIKENFSLFLFLHFKSCINNFIPPINEFFSVHDVLPTNRNTLSVLNQKGLIAAVQYYFGDQLGLLFFGVAFYIYSRHVSCSLGCRVGSTICEKKLEITFSFWKHQFVFFAVARGSVAPPIWRAGYACICHTGQLDLFLFL